MALYIDHIPSHWAEYDLFTDSMDPGLQLDALYGIHFNDHLTGHPWLPNPGQMITLSLADADVSGLTNAHILHMRADDTVTNYPITLVSGLVTFSTDNFSLFGIVSDIYSPPPPSEPAGPTVPSVPPVPSGPTGPVTQLDQARALVSQMYQDLLGRRPDAAGLASWAGHLLAGRLTQGQVAAGIAGSTEYVTMRIAAEYRAVLGRQPDATGLAYWTGQVLAGRLSVEDIPLALYQSVEFYQSVAAGSNAAYIRALYQGMLGRPASNAEVAFNLIQLLRVGRAGLAEAIWRSPEAARLRVTGHYLLHLNRAPDASGLQGWASHLASHGEFAVRTGIMGSAEYRTNAIRKASR